MRARVAYISSLGTTAILVAAAMLMLVVVGAIVAFRGWPGVANGSGVQSVPLAPQAGAAHTVLARPVSFTRRVVRVSVRPSALVAIASRRTASTAGLVKQPSRGPLVHGLVMVSVPGATMRPASPRSVDSVGPGTVPSPVDTPGGPGSGPAPIPPSPTGRVTLPVPLPPPPPGSSPGSDELSAVVNGLLGGTPPPPVAAVEHLLRH
jgi:hypothetical protein